MHVQAKTILLTGTAAVALTPMAHAADLPAKAARVMPPPAPTWTGLYIGAHAGAAWQQGQNLAGGAVYTPNHTSFIGGGQLGYNWQKGNFVLGVEVDGSWLSNKKLYTTGGGNGYITYGNHISWLSTARLRMGLAVNDTMVYLTGGGAFGEVQNTRRHNPPLVYSVSKTRFGWVVGGGIEHMWTQNWTIGLEALFVDLGKTDGTGSTDPVNTPINYTNHALIGRLKLNYKF